MKLCCLRVSNLAAIRDTEIEFGPGLNVLYGPNDLGKSTLVDAIRLALLLPHTSAHCDQFISWTGAFNPVIELTFETEAQRIWRVKKNSVKAGRRCYRNPGTDATSKTWYAQGKLTQSSERFSAGALRSPAGWRGQGLPLSFLATALLSTQADVTAMLPR